MKNGMLESGDKHTIFGPLPSAGWYDVSADGQRFLEAVPEKAAPVPLTLVQNWIAGMKEMKPGLRQRSRKFFPAGLNG